MAGDGAGTDPRLPTLGPATVPASLAVLDPRLQALNQDPLRISANFAPAPRVLPVPFQVRHLACLPPALRPWLPGVVCEPSSSQAASAAYVEGLIAPAGFAIAAASLVLLIVAPCLLCAHAAACACCCSCCGGSSPPCCGGELDLDKLSARARQSFKRRGAGPGTRAAACCFQLAALCAAGICIALVAVPSFGLASAAHDVATGLDGASSTLSGAVAGLDAVVSAGARLSADGEAAAAELQLAGLPAEAAAARAALDEAGRAVGFVSAGLNNRSGLAGAEDEVASAAAGLRGAATAVSATGMGVGVGAAALLLLLALTPTRCRCCPPCCFRLSAVATHALGTVPALAALVVLVTTSSALADACVGPGAYVATLIAAFANGTTDILAPASDPGSVHDEALMANSVAQYFAPPDTLALLDASGAAAGPAGCVGPAGNGSTPAAPGPATVAGQAHAASLLAASLVTSLTSLNASVSASLGPGSDAAVLTGQALTSGAGLRAAVASAAARVGCNAVRGMAQAVVTPVCSDVVAAALSRFTLGMALLVTALLFMALVSVPLCLMHPGEAKAAFEAATDAAVPLSHLPFEQGGGGGDGAAAPLVGRARRVEAARRGLSGYGSASGSGGFAEGDLGSPVSDAGSVGGDPSAAAAVAPPPVANPLVGSAAASAVAPPPPAFSLPKATGPPPPAPAAPLPAAYAAAPGSHIPYMTGPAPPSAFPYSAEYAEPGDHAVNAGAAPHRGSSASSAARLAIDDVDPPPPPDSPYPGPAGAAAVPGMDRL